MLGSVHSVVIQEPWDIPSFVYLFFHSGFIGHPHEPDANFGQGRYGSAPEVVHRLIRVVFSFQRRILRGEPWEGAGSWHKWEEQMGMLRKGRTKEEHLY